MAITKKSSYFILSHLQAPQTRLIQDQAANTKARLEDNFKSPVTSRSMWVHFLVVMCGIDVIPVLPYIPDYKTRFYAKFKASKSKGRLIHRE